MKTTIDRVADDVAVLKLEGELDASNYRDVMAAGEQLYGEGVRRLVLDMADLEYMSSSGIVALHSLALVYRGEAPHGDEAGWEALHAAQADAEAGGDHDQVRLAGPTEAIQVVLDRTGMNRIMPVFPDRDAALNG